VRRGLPERGRDLARLDPGAVERVRAEARLDPRDAEELHEALLDTVVLRPDPAWASWFEALAAAGRAARVDPPAGPLWLAAERRSHVEALFPGAPIRPDVRLPSGGADGAAPDDESAAVAAVRGHLAHVGPCTLEGLAGEIGLAPAVVAGALARLEAEGVVLRGAFEAPAGGEGVEFCDRRLLARIHRYTTDRLRREIEPVTAQDLVRFLLHWQHVAPGAAREGRRGLLAVVEQLQGFEVAAAAWEAAVLPARVAGYRTEWLDDLCLSGEVAWARLAPRSPAPGEPNGSGAASGRAPALAPSRATPVSLLLRENLPWLLAAARGAAAPEPPGDGAARDVLDALRSRGALFHRDLAAVTGRPAAEVEDGLWTLVARGLVAADGFGSLRGLLSARGRWARRLVQPEPARLRRGAHGREGAEGRWAVLPPAPPPDAMDVETLADAVAEQLLARWGVVVRDLLARETLALPWREVLRGLRRLEARGLARGGRFVTGFVGEQYALPEAVEALRRIRREAPRGELVRVSAADPLNLVGILTPGPRVPAVRGQVVVYRDGAPLSADDAAQLPRRPAAATGPG
jgi:ATP-dependent Lhr-like helicase